jgi:hypothetical protein
MKKNSFYTHLSLVFKCSKRATVEAFGGLKIKIRWVYMLGLALMLSACSDEAIQKVTTLNPGESECSAGGVLLQWGEDANGNGKLDKSEVSGHSVSCQVPMLATSRKLNAGEKGCVEGGVLVSYGHDTNNDGAIDKIQSEIVHCQDLKNLIETEKIAAGPGEECVHGGLKLIFGLDANGNKIIDQNEITNEELVCQQRIDGYSNLIKVEAEAPGTNCRSGGDRYSTGLDLNQNLILDANEVLYVSYSCDGDTSLVSIDNISPGNTCETGGVIVHSGSDTNLNGLLDFNERQFSHPICNGQSTLVRIDSIQSGMVCQQGGIRVHTGFDKNANSLLDNGEISKSEVVCNGIDGLTTLVNMTELPINLQAVDCQFGGTRIDTGLDRNRSGVLDAGEILHTQTICRVQVNENQNVIKFVATYPEAGLCQYGGIITKVGLDTNNNRVLDPSEETGESVWCNQAIIVDGRSTLTRTRNASTADCQFGGYYIESGLDLNRNNILAAEEITNSSLVCNGINGLNSLVATENYSGSTCTSGTGERIKSGLDTNRNNILDSNEVTKTTIVCDGQKGDVGISSLVDVENYTGAQCGGGSGVRFRTGPDNNRNSSLDLNEVAKTEYVCDGLQGFDGYDSLVKTTTGTYASCNGGYGVKIESGVDTNVNGSLGASEVTSTSYVCDGVDGFDGVDGYDGADGLVEVSGGYYGECGGEWGILVEGGTDYNGNGSLSGGEINSSEIVCEIAP